MHPSTRTPRTPWYRRGGVLVAAGLLALLVFGIVVAGWVIRERTGLGCSSSEQTVMEEFPHYGNQRFEPFSGEVECIVRYTTNASRDEVLTHYEERLRENGWEAMWAFGLFTAADPKTKDKTGGERLSDLPAGWAGGIAACRGGYRYLVEYWPPPEPEGKQKNADERFSSGGYPVSGDEAVVDVGVSDDQGGPCSE